MFLCVFSKTAPDNVSLVDFAYGFSPLVEETASDIVVMDIEGCELMFGSAYELATTIASSAIKPREAGGLDCKVNVAVAGNPDAAIHAARFFADVTFIAPGEELTCLGDLPLEALCPTLSTNTIAQNPKSERSHPTIQSSPPNRQMLVRGSSTLDQQTEEILETLKLWGVRSFRDFAALPTVGVSERLGQAGIALQQLAAGKTIRHLKLKQPAPVFENSLELEHALSELEPLSFIFARLLNQLCASLNAYALATNELRVRLKLESKMLYERTLNLPYPMRDHKVFLKLLLLDVEMHPPQSPVIAISIICEPVKPRILQNGLFIPLAPEPAKLELTLARLGKLVGSENIGSPEVMDTHRPDAFRLKRFIVKSRTELKKNRKKVSNYPAIIRSSQNLLGFRVFRPPLRALVQAEHGYPAEVSAWGANRSVYGKIISAAGPWRTSGDWWRNDRWGRDEWDVAIKNHSLQKTIDGKPQIAAVLYRIYQELPEGSWFVEGMYD